MYSLLYGLSLDLKSTFCNLKFVLLHYSSRIGFGLYRVGFFFAVGNSFLVGDW